ncbi:transcription factor Ouib isoform X1 [Drosophila elegans]|uniref:transcription factor Ouib isoform X1 n=1 Tax=Drosophila elegans TaxID=30023 RepID=UPI0007E86509|nr:transcription factor Ouib isoform X1 [Drosophila elegans]
MRYICRTCSRMADPAAAKNIFEPSSASVLQQIETLTNLQLKKDDKLPRFMCQECQRDLQIAIDFRRVCIEAQELLELQLKQVEKEEEALESLAEQWLDDCPEEFPDLRSDPQDKEEDKTLIGHVTQDEDALETMSIASMELLNTTVCKEKFLPEDSPHVLPEFSADSQLSEENFDLLLSPEAELPESEAIDDPDSSSHTCSKCGLDFDDLDELRTHKYHLHDVPLNSKFVCDHCSEGFRSAAALTRHCNMLDFPATHACTKCSLKFHNQILLETHEERCQKPSEALHVCHICGKRLTTAFNLKNHLVRHAGTRPHKCHQCDASFSTAAELSSHRKTHTSERPYACRYDCGKTFRFCSARSMHERIHMDASKRIYQCEYCPKSYVTASDCRTHQKYHNLTRDHSCDTCRISFKTVKHYKSHLKSNAHKTLEARATATKR